MESLSRFYSHPHLVGMEAKLTRSILSLALAVLLLAAGPARAGVASLEEAMAEKVIGDPKAPVTIIEYASLGCSHCADFHKQTLPQIKKAYIETGKAKMIFREFPLGGPAMAAAMIARCGGNAKYFGLVDLFFMTQAKWTAAPNPLVELEKLAKQAGMSSADVEACTGNEALFKAIQEQQKEGVTKYNVEATPTFNINGTRIPGAVTFEDFKKVMDAELAKTK